MLPYEGSQGDFLLGELAPECQPSISSGWISMRSDLLKPSEEEDDDNYR